jgi:hemerythrin superfamily protein
MAHKMVARPKAPKVEAGVEEGIGPHDALDLLAADHVEIDGLFHAYQRRRRHADRLEKGKLALRICQALTVHARVEQEIFYPAVAAVLDGGSDELLGRANVEHDGIQGLISKIEDTSAADPLFDSMIEVLASYVTRHAKAEEEHIFPKVRHSRLDLLGTGERLAARKLELATAHFGRQLVGRARKVMGGKVADRATSRPSLR